MSTTNRPSNTTASYEPLNCNGNILMCGVCRFLLGFNQADLVFGIGIVGCIVLLVASTAIIAVCCDRRCRKRNLPASARPTEANKEASSSETRVRQSGEHQYYNESATTAAIKRGELNDTTPPYSTVYELATQIPGERLNTAQAGDGCAYAEVAKSHKLRPNNHSNDSTGDTVEYADTAAVQRNGARFPGTGGGYEEALGPTGADSNENLWQDSGNPYDGALAVDAGALEQRGDAGRRGEAIHMQNCGLPLLPDEDITLVDNCMYSNAASIQRR